MGAQRFGRPAATPSNYYNQARKLKEAYDIVSDLRLTSFNRILANEIFQSIMTLNADDQDLKTWLELADGASDLQNKLGVFQSKFRSAFKDFPTADNWSLGDFRMNDGFKSDDLLTFEAQHQTQKAALLQAWAYVAEGKYSHDQEGSKFTRVMDLWESFQNDDTNLTGRQRGLDSANANAYALKEAQLKRLRALQGIITMVSLNNSRRQYRVHHTAKKSVAMLELLSEAADDWANVSDQVVH